MGVGGSVTQLGAPRPFSVLFSGLGERKPSSAEWRTPAHLESGAATEHHPLALLVLDHPHKAVFLLPQRDGAAPGQRWPYRAVGQEEPSTSTGSR